MKRLQALGEVGALSGGGVCRLALTDADRAGRNRVVEWMHEAGLEVVIDAVGNVTGTRAGLEDLSPVMTGSHIDTVRTGGLYDGTLGVLAGLEVIHTLNDAGVVTRRPLAVSFFTNEEGARFSPDMMGSLVYHGRLPLEDALSAVGIDGMTVGEELERIGYRGKAPVGSPDVHAFVELHIEQGPVLSEEGFSIGAVGSVQGISWSQVQFGGQSNHAGTTPMRLRRDAAHAAAELACFVRRLVEEVGGNQVGTVGRIELQPNLINVVANKACVTVDLRNTDAPTLWRTVGRMKDFVHEVASTEGLEYQIDELVRLEPVTFDPSVVSLVEQVSDRLGYRVRRLPSGAGHDAQMFAPHCPTAMIFVPSELGISHNIDEYTAPEDLRAGADVLLHTLLQLAQ
jgi:N-carbamoyl-L-amino-acid hydrolase